jgi:hypothetical protein
VRSGVNRPRSIKGEIGSEEGKNKEGSGKRKRWKVECGRGMINV